MNKKVIDFINLVNKVFLFSKVSLQEGQCLHMSFSLSTGPYVMLCLCSETPCITRRENARSYISTYSHSRDISLLYTYIHLLHTHPKRGECKTGRYLSRLLSSSPKLRQDSLPHVCVYFCRTVLLLCVMCFAYAILFCQKNRFCKYITVLVELESPMELDYFPLINMFKIVGFTYTATRSYFSNPYIDECSILICISINPLQFSVQR